MPFSFLDLQVFNYGKGTIFYSEYWYYKSEHIKAHVLYEVIVLYISSVLQINKR
jgi:hypothetical protein